MSKFDFFSYIGSRYSCSTNVITERQIPEFDNLYLDLNLILHSSISTKSCDSNFNIRKKEFSDEQIFENVSDQIDFIFRTILPTKLMFLAFDGVAPCAKLNRQRIDRFFVIQDKCTCYDKNLDSFDKNSFTAGSIFMVELIEYIKHFVAYKISIDPAWKKCKIIVSGSEVPGESKFKITNFIRYNKTEENTRHCIFTSDSDLILLGLSTHEPYFSLMHNFTPFMQKKNVIPGETNFFILHLSLVREFLEHEFSSLKQQSKFKFELDKIIDDWILIGFLIGDDSLPHLPYLNTKDEALSFAIKVYMKVLPIINGYINESGKLNMDRLEIFLQKLSCIEKRVFEKTGQDNFNIQEIYFDTLEHEDLNNLLTEFKTNVKKRQNEVDTKLLKVQKNNYYELKFDHSSDEQFISAIVADYVKSIQWTLDYYYHGCSSWTWYYPYHYPPLISDIKNLKNIDLNIEMGNPLFPLEYLLAVLPRTSNRLLPPDLRNLLISDKSTMIKFYPRNNFQNLNHKYKNNNDLKSVPFVNVNTLRSTVEQIKSNLTLEESNRNTHGKICVFTYAKHSSESYSSETKFKKSFSNHAELKFLTLEDMYPPKQKLERDGLCKWNDLNNIIPGFPTLKQISHKCHLMVFNGTERMIINIPSKHICSLQDVARELLGKSVLINWPYVEEGLIHSVTNFERKISLKNKWTIYSKENINVEVLSKNELINLKKKEAPIINTYESLGIDIGEIKILLSVFPRMAQQYVCEMQGRVNLRNKFDIDSIEMPYQLAILKLSYDTPLYNTISDLFETSKTCFMIGQPYYGSMGKVKRLRSEGKQVTVTVSLTVTAEPNFHDFQLNDSSLDVDNDNEDYWNINQISKKFSINAKVIDNICKRFWVVERPINKKAQEKRHNIGLRIKYPSKDKEQLPGYTIKRNDTWAYSKAAIDLIENYILEFPSLFKKLNKTPNICEYEVHELFENGLSDLELVQQWLRKSQVFPNNIINKTNQLIHEHVKELEDIVSDFYSEEKDSKLVEVVVSPNMIFKPGTIAGVWPVDFDARHDLLDRIISVRKNFIVPFGLKGTIISIYRWSTNVHRNIYEILFDSPFPGGLTLYGSSENRCYRLTIADFINISFGERNENYQKRIAPIKAIKPTKVNEKKYSKNKQSKKSEDCRDNKVPKPQRKLGSDFHLNF